VTDNHSLVTDRSQASYDKIGKVRFLVDHFVSRSKELYNPGRYITVDEMMVAYRGRYSSFRQYMVGKPTKYGFKFWVAISTELRYIYNIIPYLGKQGEVDVVQSERVILELISGLEY